MAREREGEGEEEGTPKRVKGEGKGRDGIGWAGGDEKQSKAKQSNKTGGIARGRGGPDGR